MSIDPETDAVVGAGVKGERLAHLRNQCATPANREVVSSHRRIGGLGAPFKIDLGIGSLQHQILEALTIEVVRLQAGIGKRPGDDERISRKVSDRARRHRYGVGASRNLRWKRNAETLRCQLGHRGDWQDDVSRDDEAHIARGKGVHVDGFAEGNVDVVDSRPNGAAGNMRNDRWPCGIDTKDAAERLQRQVGDAVDGG